MKKYFFLFLFMLLSVLRAYSTLIDGINYSFNTTTKEAHVARYKNDAGKCLYSGDIVIPENIVYNSVEYRVVAINEMAFYGCEDRLYSVTIPNSVTSIGEKAFGNCTKLKSITVPDSVISIGSQTFSECSRLTTVTIGNSVTSIGYEAFYKCSNLISLNLPNSVRSIANLAFAYCSSLTYLSIGNGLTSISSSAFKNCSNLTFVTLNSNAIVSRDRTEDNSMSYYFGSQVKDYIIGEDVTAIGDNAFNGCTGLTSVTIGNNVTSIGIKAFCECSSLSTITIPNSVITIGMSAFYDCTGLKSATIGNGVTTIDTGAFYGCNQLREITALPETPPEAQDNSFSNYNIPLKVPKASLESYQNTSPWSNFQPVLGIETGDDPGGQDIEDENHISFTDPIVRELCMANWDTDGNGSLSYEEAALVTDLAEVFADNADIISFNELQYFTGLTAISDNAFSGCINLATITLPETIVSINSYAFNGCKALTSFTIPHNVNVIGSYAFRGCSGLTDVFCDPVNVPTSPTNIFNNSNIAEATLHVVVTSYDAYHETEPWKNFKNMLGDIPVPCATPVISYVDGQLVFDCDTEGVTFKSSITCEDIADREESTIDLTVAYVISVYATKTSYNPSETATATLCWIETEPVDQVATGTVEIAAVPVLVKSSGGVITVEGVGNNTMVSAYTTDGMLVGSATAANRMATINTSLTPGTVAIVKMGGKSVKIIVR